VQIIKPKQHKEPSLINKPPSDTKPDCPVCGRSSSLIDWVQPGKSELQSLGTCRCGERYLCEHQPGLRSDSWFVVQRTRTPRR
jgi:hypothetical protein